MMQKNYKEKQTILIADDSEINRAMLFDILSDSFDIIEVKDGREAVHILSKKRGNIALLLLDIVMPNMDGFDVLAYVSSRKIIDEVPVVMISAESSPAYIKKSFEYGAIDFISRPFDPQVVLQRVHNALMLHTRQSELRKLIVDRVEEKEREDSLLVNILGTVAEFRTGESGLHVLRMRIITELLMEELKRRYPEYGITQKMLTIVSNASVLHDIGKIVVPDSVLNKPGRLTKAEFEKIKQHSAAGAVMLDKLKFGQDEFLMHFAKQICHWHHERYDGKGYPDGLKGDDIPIAAQVVGLADVYDALVSPRVYKPAYSHDDAVAMIKRGECGAFNPKLLECFFAKAHELDELVHLKSIQQDKYDASRLSSELLYQHESNFSDRSMSLLERERTKYQFLAAISDEVLVDYDYQTDIATFSGHGEREFGLSQAMSNFSKQLKTSATSIIPMDDLDSLCEQVNAADVKNPIVKKLCKLRSASGTHLWYEIILRVLFSDNEQNKPIGLIGRISNVHDRMLEQSKLQIMAERDSLTKLYNLVTAEKLISDVLADGRERHCVLIVLDIDNFKSINDNYGHLFGNKVLCHISSQINSNIRSGDIASRMGGDEFLLFMADFDSQEKLLNRCSQVIKRLAEGFDGFKYTLSAGIAIYPDHAKAYSKLLHGADQALYVSKNMGRNRYTFYTRDIKDSDAAFRTPVGSDSGAE